MPERREMMRWCVKQSSQLAKLKGRERATVTIVNQTNTGIADTHTHSPLVTTTDTQSVRDKHTEQKESKAQTVPAS